MEKTKLERLYRRPSILLVVSGVLFWSAVAVPSAFSVETEDNVIRTLDQDKQSVRSITAEDLEKLKAGDEPVIEVGSQTWQEGGMINYSQVLRAVCTEQYAGQYINVVFKQVAIPEEYGVTSDVLWRVKCVKPIGDPIECDRLGYVYNIQDCATQGVCADPVSVQGFEGVCYKCHNNWEIDTDKCCAGIGIGESKPSGGSSCPGGCYTMSTTPCGYECSSGLKVPGAVNAPVPKQVPCCLCQNEPGSRQCAIAIVRPDAEVPEGVDVELPVVGVLASPHSCGPSTQDIGVALIGNRCRDVSQGSSTGGPRGSYGGVIVQGGGLCIASCAVFTCFDE